MPRPSLKNDKRREFLPILAQAFSELGYRRATTAELAGRCGVQENILYRLWPDKKAMFIAAIGYVYDSSLTIWQRLIASRAEGTVAERVLQHEAEHMGEFGQYRIVFAGLSETDDPDIRVALTDMYRRFQRFVEEQIAAHRGAPGGKRPDASLAAWAIVGLGTVASIARELGLVTPAQRKQLFADIGGLLLEGC